MAGRKQISEKSPRKLAKDKQRQHLLNANIECIAKMGLSETSITHISKAANMSRGIVNFYFESKEKMMLETLDYLLMQQELLWKSVLEESESATVFKVVAGKLLMTPSRRHQRAWMAFAAHAASHTSYGQKFKDASDALSAAMKNAGKASVDVEQFLISLSGLRLELLLNKAALSQDEKLDFIKQVIDGNETDSTVLSNDNAVTPRQPDVSSAVKKSKANKQKKPDTTDAAIGDLFANLG